MNIKKSLMVAGAVTTIGVAGVVGLGVASAATNSDGSNNLINRIATKFNLNKGEVEKVFEEERAEREAEHQQRIEERLSKAVVDGKLTEDQKAKILAKHAELKDDMEQLHEAMAGKSKEEIRELKQQHHEELQQWAEDNDIPLKYLHFAAIAHPHGHEVMFKHMPEKPANE